MLTKDCAVCIRASDYSETSQVVTLFARQSGKVRAIAKGSKRPKSAFDGPIEVLSLGDIVFSAVHKDTLATLTEFQAQPTRGGLRRTLFSLHSALFAAELLDSLTDDLDPHPALFDHFAQLLQDMDNQELISERRDVLIRLILFQRVLLGETGVHPVLHTCANCRRPLAADWREGYFSSAANGLICRDCEMSFPDKVRFGIEALHTLSDLKQIAQVDEKTLDEIEHLMIHHFTHLLGRSPKLAKHILPA
ncbi:MAG: DNA repair protein RecO [Sedimentisphaerales bacterium]|nr:DNA repair protein RecO [Sedimentisphaerales bacterium]